MKFVVVGIGTYTSELIFFHLFRKKIGEHFPFRKLNHNYNNCYSYNLGFSVHTTHRCLYIHPLVVLQ